MLSYNDYSFETRISLKSLRIVRRVGGSQGRTRSAGGKVWGEGEGACTRQNRTTVNGSSLQSSYFLMMVGRATYVRTQGTRRIESPRERAGRPNRKTVLFLIARPPCSASRPSRVTDRSCWTDWDRRTLKNARPRYVKQPDDFRDDFTIDLAEIDV